MEMRQALTLDDRMRQFGMEPDAKRNMLLPLPTDARTEESPKEWDWSDWTAPEWMYEAGRAFNLPGHVARGGDYEAKDVTDMGLALMGMGTTGAAMGGVPRGALGMNVFQGGPNKYGPEGAAKSLDHMGKGEGAQAYGWGRYDAGSEDVAKTYQDDLTQRITLDGKPVLENNRVVGTFGNDSLDNNLLAQKGDLEAAISEMKAYMSTLDPWRVKRAGYDKQLADLESLRGRVGSSTGGNLYKHDLPDEDIARYMDWDKPLSEQPESVRAALEQFGYKADPEGLRNYDNVLLDALDNNPNRTLPDLPADPTGEKIYQSLVDKNGALDWPVGSDLAAREAYRGSAKQAASEALGEAGVPGLKYYDGMSRIDGNAQQLIDGQGSREAALELAKKRLDGIGFGDSAGRKHWTEMVERLDKPQTRNYVTWDQGVLDRMKLLERNGEDMSQALMPDAPALPMDLPVRPSRENMSDLIGANTLGGRVVGDETVDIGTLSGGASVSARGKDDVAAIVEQMRGPDGYIERLVVDQDGNVIEGAHRIDALRQLGINNVPVTRIVDPSAGVDLVTMGDAINKAGAIRSDHVNQIISQVGDMLADVGGNPALVRAEFEFPKGFEKFFEAALDSMSGKPNTLSMGGSPIAAAPLAIEQRQKPTITPEMMKALLYSQGGA